jgi:hypothetical protein
MQDFDILHAVKVKERKWGCHPFYHLFTSIHAFQCLAPTFPWAHNQEETTSLYDDVVCTWRGYRCLTLCHGLQGFLNYTYFQEGYKVHWCTQYTELPKATHQDGFLNGHIVGYGWLFFEWLKRRDPCCLPKGWDHWLHRVGKPMPFMHMKHYFFLMSGKQSSQNGCIMCNWELSQTLFRKTRRSLF